MIQLAAAFLVVAGMAVSSDDTLEQAHRLLAGGRVEAAEELLQQELENHPENGRLRHTLATVLVYDGRVDEAITLLKEGVTEDADDETRMNLLLYAGELSVTRAEDGPRLTRRRGRIMVRPPKPGVDEAAFVEEHLAAAEASLREAMKIAPDYDRVLRGLAKTLALAERSEAATELWSKLLEQDPKNREATIELASLRFKLQQAEAAVELLENALQDRPNDSAMLQLLLEHYETTGEAEAIDYWKRRHQFSKRVPPFVSLEDTQGHAVGA